MHHKAISRSLVHGALALLLIAAVLTFACSKSTSPSSPGTVGTADIVVTSTVSLNHTHQIRVKGSDVDTPPVADKTIDTTTYGTAGYGGHSHTVTLTPQDYQTIQGGGQVTVTTSVVESHTHDFTISKS